MQRDTKTPTGNAVPRGGEKETQMCLSHPHSTKRNLERKVERNFAKLRDNNRKLAGHVSHVGENPPADMQELEDSFAGHLEATLNLLDAIRRDTLEIVRLRAHELEDEKQRREAAEQVAAAERATIKAITGEDLSRYCLETHLVDAYRAGGDYLKYLEAMRVLDDEDLAIAGRTSWDELSDEDEVI